MRDGEFKNLRHIIGELRIASYCSGVSAGYKPDLTIVDSLGRLKFVVECEQKTDRKAFLGDLIKAEKYAQETLTSPVLVIVMQEFDNTTVAQIANHLQNYANWLHKVIIGGLKLSEILIISDQQYRLSVQTGEGVGSAPFRKRATAINWRTIAAGRF